MDSHVRKCDTMTWLAKSRYYNLDMLTSSSCIIQDRLVLLNSVQIFFEIFFYKNKTFFRKKLILFIGTHRLNIPLSTKRCCLGAQQFKRVFKHLGLLTHLKAWKSPFAKTYDLQKISYSSYFSLKIIINNLAAITMRIRLNNYHNNNQDAR